MIELGALLGAMIVTLGTLIAAGQIENLAYYLFATFVGAPIFGALWGAAVAALIHVAFVHAAILFAAS